jgi:hypothetical protein
MQQKSCVCVLVALAWSAGCGSTTDDDGRSTTPVPLEEIPALYGEAYCQAARACWGDVLELLLAGEDCAASTQTALGDELSGIEQAVDEGTVRYDGTKIQACVDAVVARGCDSGPEPPECTAAIDGTVQIGGACSMTIECAGADTYCKTSASCPGTCERRESAGSSCERDSDCAAGLACSEQTQRCFAPVSAGDRCGGGIEPECGPGLFCLGEDEDQGRAGNCRAIDEAFSGAEGDSCLLDGAPFCEASLRCVIDSIDPTTGQIVTHCSPPITSGSACKLSFPDVCPVDEYCAVPPQSLDGTCTPKPGAGELCGTRSDEDANICAPGMRCDAGTCRPRQRLGGTCQTDVVCYSNTCEGGACVSSGSCE